MKPSPPGEVRRVYYSQERWQLLKRLREKAIRFMRKLNKYGIEGLVHGSLARGDVTKKSDIDIFIPYQIPLRIQLALQDIGEIYKKEVVIATPWALPKAHIYLDERTCVTFPLLEPTQTEIDFYYFGGAIDLKGLEEGKRVAGVDKRLMLIEPTPYGHLESSILGREGEVAKKLKVGVEIVRERIDVLTRRAEVGHTGLYYKRELACSESFEQIIPEVMKKVRCR